MDQLLELPVLAGIGASKKAEARRGGKEEVISLIRTPTRTRLTRTPTQDGPG